VDVASTLNKSDWNANRGAAFFVRSGGIPQPEVKPSPASRRRYTRPHPHCTVRGWCSDRGTRALAMQNHHFHLLALFAGIIAMGVVIGALAAFLVEAI
jgi:hypothetical protein